VVGAVAYHENEEAPLALDKIGIQKSNYRFQVGILKDVEAGFQVMEIHAAHGI
jgi:2,4-dienoyl-CoA reductase-like NADH-dependent reductase (Old Yellow Enzyme family)